MNHNEQNRLTEGSVPRKMLAFALPIFLSNLFQQLYNAVDSLIVGNFIGRAALAAVSSSSSMILLMVGFINGVSLGAGVLIARYYGAEDDDNMERAVHTTVAFGLVAGAVMTVVGMVLSPQILQWMDTPQAASSLYRWAMRRCTSSQFSRLVPMSSTKNRSRPCWVKASPRRRLCWMALRSLGAAAAIFWLSSRVLFRLSVSQ